MRFRNIGHVCVGIAALAAASGGFASTEPLSQPSSQTAIPAKQYRETLYVQAAVSKDIYMFDAQSFQQIGRIDIGDNTDDVIGLTDGSMIFTNAILSSRGPSGDTIGEVGKVFGIDTGTNKVVWSTFVSGTPQHMAASPDGKRLYVSLFDRHHIYVLNPLNGEIIARWNTMFGNHGLEVVKDGKYLVAGNVVADNIIVIETETGRTVQMINAGAGVRPFDFGPDDDLVYYQLSKLHGFEVRELLSGKLLRKVALPKLPVGTVLPEAWPYTINHGLSISPDKKMLMAAGSLGDFVAIYSLPDLKLRGTVKVGIEPNWIDFRADSKIAFVSNRGEGTVSVIDAQAMREVARLPAGRRPGRLRVVKVPIQ